MTTHKQNNYYCEAMHFMKPATCLLCLCALLLCGKGQAQKYDYWWVMSYSNQFDTVDNGNFDMHFTEDSVQVLNNLRGLYLFNTQVTMSDSMGNLQFISNGTKVFNSFNDLMQNGDSINYGYYWDYWSGVYYNVVQAVLSLPSYNQPGSYNLFHLFVDFNSTDVTTWGAKLNHSQIDMNANAGMGAVMFKNRVVLEDTLGAHLTACKHANGRDWWIIQSQAGGDGCFYQLLYANDSLRLVDTFCLGLSYQSNQAGQAVFSPDGSKFARVGSLAGLHLYDFDRCTGRLSNPQLLPYYWDYDSSNYQFGVAFSPSSRFLYLVQTRYIMQFDTWAPDVLGSVDTVGYYHYDTAAGFLQPTFFIAQLAADGKIYVTANNGIKALHVINKPDEAGDACDFVNKGVALPKYNSFAMPNLPNYRLGPIDGSPCDTLGINNPTGLRAEKEKQLRIFPNPARDYVVVDYGFTNWSKGAVTLDITNEQGQTVLQQTLPMYSGLQRLDVRGFGSGLYRVCIKRHGQVVAEGRFGKL